MIVAGSVFEIFKFGICPSSSDTVGLIAAGALFASLTD
jgi:hypothetical protein